MMAAIAIGVKKENTEISSVQIIPLNFFLSELNPDQTVQKLNRLLLSIYRDFKVINW
jgi:hypothetical protein